MTFAQLPPPGGARLIDPRGHRFGAALSVVALALGLAAVALAAGSLAGASLAVAAGWALAGAVATLQLLLAATGYCLGCQLYRLRWYAPRLFDRIVRTVA